MCAELDIVDPSVLSETDRNELDLSIDALIAAHKNNRQEINRLVFESVSAITAGEDYERQLANKKGLRRFIGGITGSNKKLQDKINSSRAAAQYASQQTLQRLAEQNLMSFDLITAVNNKLNASVTTIESEINQIYSTLISFFKQNRSDMIQLENRVARLERNVNLLNWQNSIEYQMLNGVEYSELDDNSKIVCMVRDFYDITRGEWTTSDLLLLKAAMGSIGLAPRGKIGYFEFITAIAKDSCLKQHLLNNEKIYGIPEYYLVPLTGLKKLEMLNEEERYVVDTVVDTIRYNGIMVQPQCVSENLTRKFLEQENGFNVDVQIENFDLVLELLFSLNQAKAEGCLATECVTEEKHISEAASRDEENQHVPVEVVEESAEEVVDEQDCAKAEASEGLLDGQVGEIFSKIFVECDGVSKREIVAETDHYFLIRETLSISDDEDDEEDTARVMFKSLNKTTMVFIDLPALSRFIPAPDSELFSCIRSLLCNSQDQSPIYVLGDTIFIEQSEDTNTSIWQFCLADNSSRKIADNIVLCRSKLSTETIRLEGKYLPCLKNNHLCILDTETNELQKVYYEEHWIQNPLSFTISKDHMVFCVKASELDGDDDDSAVICVYDFEQRLFKKVDIKKNKKNQELLSSLDVGNISGANTGLVTYQDKTYMFTDEGIYLLQITDGELVRWSIIYDEVSYIDKSKMLLDRFVWLDYEGDLFAIDFATGKKQKIMSSVEYGDIEARIGNYLYLRHGKEGYSISLNPPRKKKRVKYSI